MESPIDVTGNDGLPAAIVRQPVMLVPDGMPGEDRLSCQEFALPARGGGRFPSRAGRAAPLVVIHEGPSRLLA